MGECPVFTLIINNDRSVTFIAKEYNYTRSWQKGKLLKGAYKTTISHKEFDELKGLLNYIDFEKLEDTYKVLWTDDQTATLKITYDNGKVKMINDYGLKGTFGLKKVHELLFNLRINQDWKSANLP